MPMKTADLTNNCIGCLEYDKEDDLCAHIPEMIRDKCPCRNCLIKMICENTCSLFSRFCATKAEKEFIIERQKKGAM